MNQKVFMKHILIYMVICTGIIDLQSTVDLIIFESSASTSPLVKIKNTRTLGVLLLDKSTVD